MTQEPDLDQLRHARTLMDRDPKSALLELRELETKGSIWSFLLLGYMFKNGLGVEVNIPRAEEYFKKAYDAGLIEGLYALGRIYVSKKEYDKAEKVFLEGVSRDYLPAIFWLAQVYQKSSSARDRKVEIELLLEKAAARGHLYAQRQLIDLLISRKSGYTNIIRGILLYLKFLPKVPWIIFRNESDERLL
jgi:TPR repeat protein